MKLLITFLISIIATTSLIGQEDRDARKERIQALKVAYLTERLELTSDQAQVFWPIYNQHGERMSAIYDTERKVLKESNRKFDTMDEATAKNTLENIQSFELQKLEAKKDLLNNLKNKLTYKKILILLKSEGDFRRDLLHKLRGNNENKKPKR